jgi:hypothetical protein
MIDQVKAAVGKRQLKVNADTQMMEDVTDLVFIEHYMLGFAGKHAEYSEEKWLDIIRKTWKKMSDRAHAFATGGGIKLPEPLVPLIMKAITPSEEKKHERRIHRTRPDGPPDGAAPGEGRTHLHLWARRPESLAPFATVNAKTHATPAQVAANAEVVIVMVADAPDVENVCLGADGLAAGGKAGLIVVDMSTINPNAARSIGSAWRRRASSSSMRRCPAARPARSTRR